MAGAAQFGLFAAFELDVTGVAVLLNIGVPGDDLAGHHQCFQLSLRVIGCEHADNQQESKKISFCSHSGTACQYICTAST